MAKLATAKLELAKAAREIAAIGWGVPPPPALFPHAFDGGMGDTGLSPDNR
jgi:hypothetical protein